MTSSGLRGRMNAHPTSWGGSARATLKPDRSPAYSRTSFRAGAVAFERTMPVARAGSSTRVAKLVHAVRTCCRRRTVPTTPRMSVATVDGLHRNPNSSSRQSRLSRFAALGSVIRRVVCGKVEWKQDVVVFNSNFPANQGG